MREFNLLNVTKYANDPLKIERLKMLGYKEVVKTKPKTKKKASKKK